MKNKSKSSSSSLDAFGSIKKYYFFAVKSPLSLVPFTASFEKIIPGHFSFLTEYIVEPEQYAARFNVMYGLLSKEEAIHCCIMENKTTNYAEKVSITSKKEKNLPFQTISLFEDVLYLFNNEGFRIFKSDLNDYDYLILIFADKEIVLEPYINPFKTFQAYKTKDLTYFLDTLSTKPNELIFSFLKTCFETLEVTIVQNNHLKLLKQLGVSNKIPKENILFPLKLDIESNILDKLTPNINENYLRFLTQEVDCL